MTSKVPGGSHHQRKLGPAPIASFEDLSDEVENGEPTVRMPGIVEVTTPVTTPGSSLKTPSTPRIDISRASSSSHHEDSTNSRESSPERELLAGVEPPPGSKLTLGYKEDAQDLRSSTEELDLQDPIHEQDLRRDSKRARRKREDGTQSECGGSSKQERERKDSNCSEIILLNISGRTSRLSSVGSQGSGVSGRLSVVSATSSRSPSPHKCLLETSFCGSKPTLGDTSVETTKPETDDLEKILLKREADTTKALIPDSIKVPIVGGNLKPDPLDKPRRRGREERKEIFKREVEKTKKVLEKKNIEVPIIKNPSPQKRENDEGVRSSSQEIQKPATLDFNDKRKKAQNFVVQTPPVITSLSGSPKLPRHQKVKELGSRTPSPSSVSRKSSFASIFKGKVEGSTLSPESPTASLKPRRSLTSKIRDTTESLRSRSKSRERTSVDKGSTKNKNVFTSTLSIFKKRERKKSVDGFGESLDHEISSDRQMIEGIGNLEFKFQSDNRNKVEDSVFISLHGDSEENYEEALPSESISIPLETPTKLLDEYDTEPRTGNIVTEVSIEHQSSSSRRIKTEAKIEAPIRDDSENNLHESMLRDSQISKISSRDSRTSIQTAKHIDLSCKGELNDDIQVSIDEKYSPPSTSKNSIECYNNTDNLINKTIVMKPKRKSKENTPPTSQIIDVKCELSNNNSNIELITNDNQLNGTELINNNSQIINNSQVLVDNNQSEKSDDIKCIQNDVSSTAATTLTVNKTDGLVKTPSVVSDLDHNSSESERDSEIDFIKNKTNKLSDELPDERKGLFNEESFEDDLPYVPTTLPLEKSVAIPILPIKQRLQEVKTIPIERPRSTTPINPTLLDEFVMHTSYDDKRTDRMKISLPREDSFKLKSPRKHSSNTFTEFAVRVGPDASKRTASTTPGKSPSPPPPLPPRVPSSKPINWVNFEEIPERRKTPKRIQTIPRSEEDMKGASYSYVQPDECKCECHEESRRAHSSSTREQSSSNINAAVAGSSSSSTNPALPRTGSTCSSSNGERGCSNGEHCTVPNNNSSGTDRASIVSDSSVECSFSIDDTQTLLGPMKPFQMDLDIGSNRSSIISQEETDDQLH